MNHVEVTLYFNELHLKAVQEELAADGLTLEDKLKEHFAFLYDQLVPPEKQLGIEAYGVSSTYRSYEGQWMRDIREVLARVKDFIYTVFQPEPTYLGEKIPLSGDGNITNSPLTKNKQ